MCKGFGLTLTGPTLQWFIHLGNDTISSFAQLINIFNLQFSSSLKMKNRLVIYIESCRNIMNPWKNLFTIQGKGVDSKLRRMLSDRDWMKTQISTKNLPSIHVQRSRMLKPKPWPRSGWRKTCSQEKNSMTWIARTRCQTKKVRGV